MYYFKGKQRNKLTAEEQQLSKNFQLSTVGGDSSTELSGEGRLGICTPERLTIVVVYGQECTQKEVAYE